jgi:polar amino acid transport system permease protein
VTGGEGPGGDAGTLTTPGSTPVERESRDRRRTIRAIAIAIATIALVLVGAALAAIKSNGGNNGILGWFCLSLPLAIFSLIYGRRAEAQVVDIDGPEVDEQRARLARQVSVVAIGLTAMLFLGLAIWNAWPGIIDVANTFFSWEHISGSFPEVFEGFMLNVVIFIVAEFFVLIWALIVVVMRQLPGRASAPLRWLAVAYVDVFRGLPAIITIYLVVFGLPLTQLPIIEDTADISFELFSFHIPGTDLGATVIIDQLVILGIFALVLIYGAYVAEVYRSGIESVHWSQRAAARGLGLSQGQSLRHVVLPQAVRRVIPPLMNDFIGLQKDTALLNIVGVLEGFNIARLYSGNNFNLSSVAGLGLCFLVITIPMTRYTDHLVKRDRERMMAGGG